MDVDDVSTQFDLFFLFQLLQESRNHLSSSPQFIGDFLVQKLYSVKKLKKVNL